MWLSNEFKLNFFIHGPEEEILCIVKMFKPQTLHKSAYCLAKLWKQNPKSFEITFMPNIRQRVVPQSEFDNIEGLSRSYRRGCWPQAQIVWYNA